MRGYRFLLDDELGEPPKRVMSISSLMAVPLRRRPLTEHLAPLLGRLLEAHPRASLLFYLRETVTAALRAYHLHRLQ